MSAERLNPAKIERALRSIISDLDYDLHKGLERGEELDFGGYPGVAGAFIYYYENDEECPPRTEGDRPALPGLLRHRWRDGDRVVIPEEAVQAVHAVILPYVDDEHFDLSAVAHAALEAAAPHMLIHVHHHDMESHARSFNEGYEAAVTQCLADDPTLADDWFQEKIREAKAEAWDESTKLQLHMFGMSLTDNPYRSKV